MQRPSRPSYKQSQSGILAAPGRSMGTSTTGQKILWRSRFSDCAPEADYSVLKAPSCLTSKRKIAPLGPNWFETAACGQLIVCTLYCLHVLEKAWHHAPFGHVTFAGPQAHVAAAGWSV